MTPTLLGRWETRLALLATIGLLISLIFAAVFSSTAFLFVLLYVAVFGVIWDVIYIGLQQLRWDRDWPAIFQVINGVTEGIFLYLVIRIVGLPGVPTDLALGLFIAQYGLVWLSIFLFTQGPMRTIFPFWRFHGGVITPRVPRER